MRTKLLQLKADLKTLAGTIRQLKTTRKPNRGYVPGLADHQFQFRVQHIAYCLARGRTWDQIENRRATNPPDPDQYQERYLQKRVAETLGELLDETEVQANV